MPLANFDPGDNILDIHCKFNLSQLSQLQEAQCLTLMPTNMVLDVISILGLNFFAGIYNWRAPGWDD